MVFFLLLCFCFFPSFLLFPCFHQVGRARAGDEEAWERRRRGSALRKARERKGKREREEVQEEAEAEADEGEKARAALSPSTYVRVLRRGGGRLGMGRAIMLCSATCDQDLR